eukprot:586718-Prorocentrum_minimum.AAC.2
MLASKGRLGTGLGYPSTCFRGCPTRHFRVLPPSLRNYLITNFTEQYHKFNRKKKETKFSVHRKNCRWAALRLAGVTLEYHHCIRSSIENTTSSNNLDRRFDATRGPEGAPRNAQPVYNFYVVHSGRCGGAAQKRNTHVTLAIIGIRC